MRDILLFLILLFSSNAISQNIVRGNVYNSDGTKLPGVKVIEIGTDNVAQTNINGQFELITVNDYASISFNWFGFRPQTIVVTSDTIVRITLNNDYYNTRWLTFGTSYEFFNSVIGLQISNGVDEESLIHFEDFQDHILFKIHGQSDFNTNYSYGVEIGVYSLRYFGRTTLDISLSF